MLATITPKSALYPTLVEAALSPAVAARITPKINPGPWSICGQRDGTQARALEAVDFAGPDWHLVCVTQQTAKDLGYSTSGDGYSTSGDNTTIRATRGESYHQRNDGWTEWSGGSPIRYRRAVNDIAIRSIARIMPSPTDAPPRRLVYVRHNSVYVLRLPKGWAWGTDGIGLRAYLVERPDCDYHPDSDDLATESGVAAGVVAKALGNEHRRLERARKAEQDAARLAECWVCLRDSVSAGNCVTGSRAFVARAGLRLAAHYRAADVLAHATPANRREVDAAVNAALERERRENAAGFCRLADHRIAK